MTAQTHTQATGTEPSAGALDELSGGELAELLADLLADIDVGYAGAELKTPAALNAREIPHGRRHPRIFAPSPRLAPDQSFTFVNNHDPQPLRHEFETTYPGHHSSDYLHTGAGPWHVRTGKPPRTHTPDHDHD